MVNNYFIIFIHTVKHNLFTSCSKSTQHTFTAVSYLYALNLFCQKL